MGDAISIYLTKIRRRISTPPNISVPHLICTRCAYACDKCAESMPEFREVKPGHFVACHRVDEI